jgi:hypothetical protein
MTDRGGREEVRDEATEEIKYLPFFFVFRSVSWVGMDQEE